jgi:hypothetical protein
MTVEGQFMDRKGYCPGHPVFLRLLIALLVIVGGAFPPPSGAQGLLPTLDNDSPPSEAMTPITELTGVPLRVESAVAPATPSPSSAHADEPQLAPIPGHGQSMEPSQENTPAPQATTPTEPELKSVLPARDEAVPLKMTANPAPVEKVSVKTTPAPALTAPKIDQPIVAATEKKKAAPKPAESKPVAASPEPAAPRKPIKLSIDFSQAIQDAKNIFKTDEKAIKPISYTPLPGIAVFAVVKHGNDRVFGDLPLLFAREYAQRLGAKVPGTKIYNPIYTVDELRMQGLGHIYDQIMAYYVKTGAPEPTAMDYLLKQLSTNRPNISRVIFVEADVDYSHPDASTSLMDRVKLTMTDDMPKQMKYFVNSRLQIFDAEKPGFPIVWAGSWRRSVKTDQFYNVTPSVYSDSDSQQAFARVSRQMSQEIIYVTPKDVYMAPQFDTDVEGKLVTSKQPAFPNLPESQMGANNLSHENKQAIERILKRQNDISP